MITTILGELIEEYVRLAMAGARDCRLVVPAPTDRMAREIHEHLCSRAVNSYLVIGNDYEPDEGKRWIRPIGLTSKRIGSFVAIACPGQLAHIQDSIRGSGGAIRSLAFPEEWPWIDNGSEAFRFNGPVLDLLVKRWSSLEDEQAWLREFVLEGLLKSTKTSSWRSRLLLENMLGTFSPALYSGLDTVREKLLFHVGVPNPSQGMPSVNKLIRNSSRLCQRIIEKCQKEDDVREQVRDRVPEVVTNEAERAGVTESLDTLLDGIGSSKTLSLGSLSFYSCWGNENDVTHWLRLDQDRLASLFSVKREGPQAQAEVSYELECQRSVIASDGKAIATFFGEKIHVIVTYRVPEEILGNDSWQVCLMYRGRGLVGKILTSPRGTLDLMIDTSSIERYSRKIPLKLALLHGKDVRAEVRLALHLCGEDRPAFVVAESGFEVVDPTSRDDEEAPDKKIETEEAVHLFMFYCKEESVEARDIDGERVDIVEIERGVWRSAHRIDPSLQASGQYTCICEFDDKTAVICFEAKDVERGEFTLEDELRVQLMGTRDGRIKEVVDIFSGKSREQYLRLGKLNDASRRRKNLAAQMLGRFGWRPLLTDLLNLEHEKSGSIGDYISYLGNIDTAGLASISLPTDALELLRAYSEARNAICSIIQESIDTNPQQDHPVYASNPIFIQNNAEKIEELLVAYLKSYQNILIYLNKHYRQIEWLQVFVLTYLDCIVHWGRDSLKNAIFLVGPWHPLVLAKRYMVQSALFERACRLLNERNGKAFRKLAALLENTQGFRWLIGLSADDRLIEPVYTSPTSDPGWHTGFKTNIGALAAQSEHGSLTNIFEKVRLNFGLDVTLLLGGTEDLASSCLSSYMRAFPSRRSVGIRVRRDYAGSKIVKALDRFLHAEDGPTDQGLQLQGGVKLFFETFIGQLEDVRWVKPPLQVYKYQDDAVCFKDENPDIYMLSRSQGLSFRVGEEKYALPRGQGNDAVFSEPLNWLTEGQSMIPKSITYEFDVSSLGGISLGETFVNVVAQVGQSFDDTVSVVHEIELPQRLDSPWAIAPGGGVDPAIFVKYVREGITRSIQERALWDYRVDIVSQQNSFYILSTIPGGFIAAVNGIFGRDKVAVKFLEELGRVGIAIGGEALKSGRHALGVIGLVGAVRMFLGIGGNGLAPLKQEQGHVGFLIPVDSFSSFFGYSDQSGDMRRTDLLAVQLVLPEEANENIKIYACGVESKFVSGAFSQIQARSAIEQARVTVSQFEALVDTSSKKGAMPERLGVLALLKFGLRISCPSSPAEIIEWIKIERKVYEAILQGKYEYARAKHDAVLVTTECGLPGVPEANVLPDGFWIRLNKEHWPGINDTLRLDAIRQQLVKLFEVEQPVVTERPIQGEKPGAPLVAEPEIAMGEVTARPLKQILIGSDEKRRAVYYDPHSPIDPLDNLNTMITGSSGTGKTQFLKYLICQLREQDKNVLILDFKNDFASDSVFTERARLSRVFVAFDGLPYNPLIPYPVRHPATGDLFIQCGQHIAGVVSVLRRTYGLGAQQQAAVKNAIVAAFESSGIQTSGSVRYSNDIQFPDFSHVGNALQSDNPAAYNRLDPLFTLGLFKDEFRGNSFHSLVGSSTILDLSQIPSDEIKNALAQLVVLSAHAYYNSQPHSGTMRQMLVFDEAHRVLSSDYMLKLVRECRAYGVGTILSSQYPTDFPPEISASMATKILYGNGRDMDRVRAIVQLISCEGQEAEVSNLERFQAFLDNRHNPRTLTRTMNYPLYLIWTYLQERRSATRDELSCISGLDTSKLPLGNLIRQLELLGLAEEHNGHVRTIGA